MGMAGVRWLTETGSGRSEGGKNGMVDGDSTVRGRNMQRRRRGMSEVGGNVRGIGCRKVNMQSRLEGEWAEEAGRGSGESGRGEGGWKGIGRGQKWEWLKEVRMGRKEGGRNGKG